MIGVITNRVRRYLLNVGPMNTVFNVALLVFIGWQFSNASTPNARVILGTMLGAGMLAGLCILPVIGWKMTVAGRITQAAWLVLIPLVLAQFVVGLPAWLYVVLTPYLGFVISSGFLFASDPRVLLPRGVHELQIKASEREARGI